MKILLTGGLGFIGKRFIRKFGDNYKIIVFARKEKIEDSIEDSSFKNVIFEEGDIEDNAIIDAISKHKPDVVVHLAALTGLKKCSEDPEKTFKINVYGTHNVITSCIKTNSRLIFISSREVYGETVKNESVEDDVLKPKNIYGLTKLIGENLVRIAGDVHNLDYTIFRITNAYGPEGDNYGAQIMIKNAINEKKIIILGGNQKLNFIYVDDIAEALANNLDNKESSRQTFNLGSTDTLSIEEFVNKIRETLDFSVVVEYHSMRISETINFNPSLNKTKNILKFVSKTTIDEGIKKTIKWYSK